MSSIWEFLLFILLIICIVRVNKVGKKQRLTPIAILFQQLCLKQILPRMFVFHLYDTSLFAPWVGSRTMSWRYLML